MQKLTAFLYRQQSPFFEISFPIYNSIINHKMPKNKSDKGDQALYTENYITFERN